MKPARMLAVAAVLAGALVPGARAEVRFRKIVLDKTFRSEGATPGDVNRDGRPDVLAGDVWFEAPDWKVHEIRPPGTYDPVKGYSQCFANFAQDVNGDGWVDSIVVNWPGKEAFWYENPKGQPGHWKQRLLAPSAANETPVFADLLGAGRPVLVCGVQPQGLMAYFTVPKDLEAPWDMHAISETKAPGTQQYSHGLGVGDVNGDGRADVVVTAGWWEAPADRAHAPWTFHKADLGPNCADMVVFDIDGDGDADILTSSAHDYGIWWHEQVRSDQQIAFRRQEVYKAFSQTHAIRLADFNRDGLTDFVTGKRWYAHGGKDPGGKEPAVLYWFELRRPAPGKVEFVPHAIDDDSGIGTQFELADLNGDGRPDIVASNKKGVHVFLSEP